MLAGAIEFMYCAEILLVRAMIGELMENLCAVKLIPYTGNNCNQYLAFYTITLECCAFCPVISLSFILVIWCIFLLYFFWFLIVYH